MPEAIEINTLTKKLKGKGEEWDIHGRLWKPDEFLRHCMCVRAKSLQLCLTLCNPKDYNQPGSSVYGLLQAKILELTCLPPVDLSDLAIEPTSLTSPTLAGGFFTTAAPCVDTCICMTESLCCSPETTTTLVIGYNPIQDKKSQVWKEKPSHLSAHSPTQLSTLGFRLFKQW